MKNKNLKKSLLLFGTMAYLCTILCYIAGNKTPFFEFICAVTLILSPPILYLWGIIHSISSMLEKKTNITVSIILCVFATIIFLGLYGLSTFLILIGGFD